MKETIKVYENSKVWIGENEYLELAEGEELVVSSITEQNEDLDEVLTDLAYEKFNDDFEEAFEAVLEAFDRHDRSNIVDRFIGIISEAQFGKTGNEIERARQAVERQLMAWSNAYIDLVQILGEQEKQSAVIYIREYY